MKQFLTLLMLFCLHGVFGQKYSYQFKGTLNPEQQTELLTRIESWNYFSEVKLFVKEQSGELQWIVPVKTTRSEKEAPVQMTDLKSLILSYGLEPINFTELEN